MRLAKIGKELQKTQESEVTGRITANISSARFVSGTYQINIHGHLQTDGTCDATVHTSGCSLVMSLNE